MILTIIKEFSDSIAFENFIVLGICHSFIYLKFNL
jgi:hypothetical protein